MFFVKSIIRCTFDDVTDGMVWSVLEQMKSQPMLLTNVRRNDISNVRKIGINLLVFYSDIHF